MNNLRLSDFDVSYYKDIMQEWGDPKVGQRDRESYYYNVLDENNNKIGIVGLFIDWDLLPYGEIAIDPKYRRQGYLLKIYNLLTKEKNIETLYVFVFASNLISIKAHEKAGFQRLKEFDIPEEWETSETKGFLYSREFKTDRQ